MDNLGGPSNKRKIEVIDITDADDDAYNPNPARLRKAAATIPPESQVEYNNEAEQTSGQEADDEMEPFGTIDIKIVGTRYYNGMTTVGEQVILNRAPDNAFDRNAIQVNNVSGSMIGHIPSWMAAYLSPLIDKNLIQIEGIITGKKTKYDVPIRIGIYVTTNPTRRANLTAGIILIPTICLSLDGMGNMARYQVGEAGPSNPAGIVGAGGAPPMLGLPGHNLPAIVGLGDMFQAAEAQAMSEQALSELPSATQPRRLETFLLPYQLQGLAWLLKKEHPVLPTSPKEIVQMWSVSGRSKKLYQNVATMFTTEVPPFLASGGVLADDMGLGKTLQMISLIVTNPTDERKLVPAPLMMDGFTGGTLIVAPLSVMSNWANQITQHVSKRSPLKVYVYHGQGRSRPSLKDYDVVITSYGTITSEFNARNGNLNSLVWRRIILDEAHYIRNPKSKSSLAVSALEAKSRWCLTGTPIINNLKDLYSLVRFLRYSGGLSDLSIYNSVITRAMKRNIAGDKERLQALVTALCLRRTKAMAFVDLRLPSMTRQVYSITFSPEEKAKYDLLSKEASGLLRRYSIDDSGQEVYRFILELLLRMRQVCNHWVLCSERIKSLMRLSGKSLVDLTPENREALQDILQIAIDSQEDCAVCLDSLHEPRITICKHVFGLDCITKVIEVQQKCPLCRATLLTPETSLVEPAVEDAVKEAPAEETEHIGSKLEALLTILNNTRNADPSVKTVVFSQWTSYLTLLEPQLRAHNFHFARIDGSMKPRSRDDAIDALNNDPKCTILLASLAVASVGLNLTSASQVVLCDSWWAPAIEDQAIDRVYRLGQKRECVVWRLIVEGTIEERVLDIQERKRNLVKTAFAEKKRDARETRESRIAELKVLLA
ncbi:putative SNF2 family helicase [Morchella snyderi]|nr:putative SNF2 family helicase [Morchella snyderi]